MTLAATNYDGFHTYLDNEDSAAQVAAESGVGKKGLLELLEELRTDKRLDGAVYEGTTAGDKFVNLMEKHEKLVLQKWKRWDLDGGGELTLPPFLRRHKD